MELPPGVAFIFINARHIFSLPALAALCGIKIWGMLSSMLFGVYTPIWLQVPLYMALFSLALACSVLYVNIHNRHRAAMSGAILAPQVPSRWPGALDLLLQSTQNMHDGYMGEVAERLCKENGNVITLRILWESRIFTTEPEHVKAILTTQFSSFAKGPVLYDIANSLLGTGVFNSDRDTWKFHRSMTRPFFSTERISDFEIFEQHANNAIEQLRVRLSQGYPVDFQDLTFRFTLDSATDFLFGKDVCSLSSGLVYPPNSPYATNTTFHDHSANKFARAFLEAQLATSRRTRFGKRWRLSEFWSDRVKKHMHICHEFIDPILKEALSKKQSLKEAGLIPDQSEKEREVLEGETLLDHLVNYTEDLTVIRDEILNIMIAGRDTTASTLTFVVWMLSQHPNVLHKLREEVLTIVGNSRNPTLQDLRDMKYLRAIINETLRLYPPVPFNSRTSTVPLVLPAGKGGQPVYVPANTRVNYSVFLMHRRKDLWGPDAEVFDPDRFLDERVQKYLTPNPFIFVPFNAGPRICLGRQFAYNEVSYLLVRLFQVFSSVSLAEDVQTLAPANWSTASGRKGVEKAIIRSHLTMYVHDGLWVRMEEASYGGSV